MLAVAWRIPLVEDDPVPDLGYGNGLPVNEPRRVSESLGRFDGGFVKDLAALGVDNLRVSDEARLVHGEFQNDRTLPVASKRGSGITGCPSKQWLVVVVVRPRLGATDRQAVRRGVLAFAELLVGLHEMCMGHEGEAVAVRQRLDGRVQGIGDTPVLALGQPFLTNPELGKCKALRVAFAPV